MFGEKGEVVKLNERSKEVSTILDRDSSFEGKMTFEGCVVINGRFKGEIFSEGSLIIGEGGYVEGRVDIGAIQIQGDRTAFAEKKFTLDTGKTTFWEAVDRFCYHRAYHPTGAHQYSHCLLFSWPPRFGLPH